MASISKMGYFGAIGARTMGNLGKAIVLSEVHLFPSIFVTLFLWGNI